MAGVFEKAGSRQFARLLALVFCILALASPCRSQRVLVVTTEQPSPVAVASDNGQFVVTDLIGAGLPFDVVGYSRFVTMPLAGHDVIFLNGHTSPVPVSEVAARCQAAVGEGRKVFITGQSPFKRWSPSGTLLEYVNYSYSLFGVSNGGYRLLTGSPILPEGLVKDSVVTSVILSGYFNTYDFEMAPPVTVTVQGKTVGFLCDRGGAIDGTAHNLLSTLDAGRVVMYLRYADPTVIGFANDRTDGKPIASFEVHCDTTNNLAAIDGVSALSRDFGVPLVNLLVYDRLNACSIAKWNGLDNPLMTIGSHSRTHPSSWPIVEDVLHETSEALADQNAVVPATGGYFNFSGDMDPTPAQIALIRNAGVLFGAAGSDARQYRLSTGQYVDLQRMPTRRVWLFNLAQTASTSYYPSQTLDSDWLVWKKGRNFASEIKAQFMQNVKYGLYSYGYIHDYMFNPDGNYYTSGIHMSAQIRSAIEYLSGQNVAFMPADQLVARLQDYLAGSITCTPSPDGAVTVVVNRPCALANEVKIGLKDGRVPVASGPSVISQRLTGLGLYVALQPEVTSSFRVEWAAEAPAPPEFVQLDSFVSNSSMVRWTAPLGGMPVQEFKYAVGSSPASADLEDWTSTGLQDHTVLARARLTHGGSCYVSVKDLDVRGRWSDPTVSPCLTIDLTPPSRSPLVTDDGLQQVETDYLHALWTAEDPESGIDRYQYAVGSSPGSNDVTDWTFTRETEIAVGNLNLVPGRVYYVSVRARNGASLWSPVGSSDGILVLPDPCKLGVAKRCADGITVSIEPVVVTAAFPGKFYVESLDRSSGIEVVSSDAVEEGRLVAVRGCMGRADGVRVISASSVDPIGWGSVRPVCMLARSVGGTPDTVLPGPYSGTGLNNVGLLVMISGRVTEIGPDHVCISDASLGAREVGPRHVKVIVAPPSDLSTGQIVRATGVCGLETADSGSGPAIFTRRADDLKKIVR
ncbi:MAG: hypothetical protein KBC96_07405 [Armatimonadetes bacterium]|nr:hypothetical protein [Armatimonadota bacterium]